MLLRVRPWRSDGPLERRIAHWLMRTRHRRWKQSSTASASRQSKPVTPAALIATSKAGKQLASETQSKTDAIRNIGVIAHIDAGAPGYRFRGVAVAVRV